MTRCTTCGGGGWIRDPFDDLDRRCGDCEIGRSAAGGDEAQAQAQWTVEDDGSIRCGRFAVGLSGPGTNQARAKAWDALAALVRDHAAATQERDLLAEALDVTVQRHDDEHEALWEFVRAHDATDGTTRELVDRIDAARAALGDTP